MELEELKRTIDELSDEVIEEMKEANGYGHLTNREFREYWKTKLT